MVKEQRNRIVYCIAFSREHASLSAFDWGRDALKLSSTSRIKLIRETIDQNLITLFSTKHSCKTTAKSYL